MIKFREKTIFILDENGDTMPFQIEELQTELADCFNKGNLAHESSYAEDIILSLDYFLNREDAGSLCTVQELNQMVASMLDEAGFFEIAEIYRSKKNFHVFQISHLLELLKQVNKQETELESI